MKHIFYARYKFSLQSYCFGYNKTEVTLCILSTVGDHVGTSDDYRNSPSLVDIIKRNFFTFQTTDPYAYKYLFYLISIKLNMFL